VRVAIVDSGVHVGHPHVAGSIIEGVGIDARGQAQGDFVDRLGHGTAVAAAIREKAPGATLIAVKVFDRELKATADALVAAIDWAVASRVDLINLSLGTANAAHAAPLSAALERATAAGAWVVAAGASEGVQWLPGTLPGALAVALDWTVPRERAFVEVDDSVAPRRLSIRASGYPRPIPGVPPERNLKGVSFAVANATGLLALAIDARSRA
jgi:subtilisin family serine protease